VKAALMSKCLQNFSLTWAECNVMNNLTASKGSSGIHLNESREHRNIKEKSITFELA